MIYKSITQKNCILNTDATKTQAVMSCAPEGLVVSASLAAHTVLLLFTNPERSHGRGYGVFQKY